MVAAYDSYLPAFARLIPSLAAAYDSLAAGDPRRAKLADQVAALRGWDDHWAANSVETSLAVFWGEALWAKAAQDPEEEGVSIYDRMVGDGSPSTGFWRLACAVGRNQPVSAAE
jgi:acyl-homoserine-lactone acylase